MNSSQPEDRTRRTKRMPPQSVFYDRVVPIVLIVLGLVMLGLVVIAAGVLLGYIHYQ